MNWAYVHLTLNHFPVVGIVISVALLTIALIRRDAALEKASFIAFAAVAVLAIPVYFTGEPAEEIVEALPGISEELIEEHEEAALIAFIALEALGALGVAALVLLRRSSGLPRGFTPVLLALSFAVGAWTVWTADLGGRIRHSESRPDFRVSSMVGAGEAQRGSSPLHVARLPAGGTDRAAALQITLVSLAAGAWTVWTANLGGRIRHSEARPDFSVSSTVGAGEAQWGSSRSMSRGFSRVQQTGQRRSKLRS